MPISKVFDMIKAARLSERRRLELEQANQEIARLRGQARELGELTRRNRDLESAMGAQRKSEARFRRLFESNMIGIIFADLNGNVTEANDAYLRMIGYAREDLTSGKIRWTEITPPEYRALDKKSIEEIKSRGACTPWEKEYVRKDGSRVQALVGVTLLEDSAQDCVAFILEITNRKRAEEALRLSQERYRFLAESGKVLASSLDYDKTLQNVARLTVPTVADYCQIYLLNERGEILPVAATHIDSAKEALLLDAQQRYLPNPEDGASAIVKAIRSGEPEVLPEFSDDFVKSVARDDEHLRVLKELGLKSGMVVPLVAHGNKLGAMTFVSTQSGRLYDTADLVMAEEIGRRAAIAVDNARLYQDAQEANRIKDEFLATVSHELRTPLNAILGWLHLLKTGRLDESTSKEALGTIERNARSQAQLVEDLLDISRIITGKLRMDVGPVKLEPVVKSALDGVRPAAEAKTIELHTSFDPAADEVPGDPDRLQQIIWNLLSNAIKFTPDGGRVDVRVERVRTGTDADGDAEGVSSPAAWAGRDVNRNRRPQEYARISVSDTGEGISPEFLPHVFERFRQADGSTTRLHGGLGLGLAIVRHLVEMHGGTVRADSPGEQQGATFTVNLPLISTKEDAAKRNGGKEGGGEELRAGDSTQHNHSPSPLEDDSPAQYGPLAREAGDVQPLAGDEDPCDHMKSLEGLRLLIVDDEPDTREMLDAALRQCGAEVKACASAGEAVEELQRWRPHVLIADIGMPVEDGYDMIQRIRRLDPGQGGQTPAIALTAYARIEDRERALEAGYEEHVPKPVEPDELVKTIATLAGRDVEAEG